MTARAWLRRKQLRALIKADRLGLGVGHVPQERRFHAMTAATAADWTGIAIADAAYDRLIPERLLALLRMLGGEPHGFAIDRLGHALQTATRAHQAGEDDEYVVCALLHDIGATMAPASHADIAAAILRPVVGEANHWMVAHHDVFQTYYFNHHLGHDRHGRERWRGHPHFERTARFCHLYDQSAFDPTFPTMPIAAFEPRIWRVFQGRPGVPATPDG